MAEAGGEAEKEPQLSTTSENEHGVLTETVEKDVYTSVKEKESQNEKEEESQKEMLKRKDLKKFQLAADCRVLEQRSHMNYSKEIRAELLENDSKLSKEKIDETEDEWTILGAPQDLQEALYKQKELYNSIMQSKDELINELQLKLKMKRQLYVINGRKHAEEMDLMIKGIEDEGSRTMKRLREKLAKQRASRNDNATTMALEQNTKNETITEEWVEDMEETLQQNLQTARECKAGYLEDARKKQAQLTELQEIKNATVVERLMLNKKQLRQELLKTKKANSELAVHELQKEVRKLKTSMAKKQKDDDAEIEKLTKLCQKKTEEAERKSMLKKNSDLAHSRRLKDMQEMIEEKVAKLAERAVLVDAAISKQVFGSSRKQLRMDSLAFPGPSEAQKPAPNFGQVRLQTEEEKLGAACSLDPETESPVAEMFKEKMMLEDSGPEREEWKISREPQREEKKLLCDKTAKDSSTFETRLMNLASVISEERFELWKATESKLKQYHAVLRDGLTLQQDIKELEKENQELKKRLQQRVKCGKKTKK